MRRGRTMEERLNYFTLDEYEEAYRICGEARAKQIVEDMYDDLVAHPENDVMLTPEFIAVLALLFPKGQELATQLEQNGALRPGELKALQRELAAKFPEVALRLAERDAHDTGAGA